MSLSVAQRRRLSAADYALPRSEMSPASLRKLPAGVDGAYPMETYGHAVSARGLAITQLNAKQLSLREAQVIFARTERRWGLPHKTIACTTPRRKGACKSVAAGGRAAGRAASHGGMPIREALAQSRRAWQRLQRNPMATMNDTDRAARDKLNRESLGQWAPSWQRAIKDGRDVFDTMFANEQRAQGRSTRHRGPGFFGRLFQGRGRRSLGQRGFDSQEAVVQELVVYADNDGQLYPQKQSIRANLLRKVKKGQYNPTQAEKAWKYFADSAAKKYGWDFGQRTNRYWQSNAGYGGFSADDRRAAAREWAREFDAELRSAGSWQALADEYGLLGERGLKP